MSRIWARRFWPATPRALERVTPADVAGLKEGMQRYGLLLTDAGTIKDDFMFSRLAGEADLYLVVNAGTKEGDFAYIAEKLKGAADPDAAARPRACWRCRARWRRRCWNVIRPAFPQLTFMQVRPRHGRGRARHRQPHRLYRRGRFRDFAGRRRCRAGGARAAGRKPMCCPSGLAPATACGWKPGSAFTAMTSTRPAIRRRPA